MTNRIGLVYVENDTRLLGPIGLGVVCDKTRQENDVTDLPCVSYTENETEVPWLIGFSVVYHEK